MPRCVSDADAKRPCTKRATQRALARFVNPLTASKMRSTMPSASRSHHPTSGHAAQEQRQLPHAIAMATHTACGVSGQEQDTQDHMSKCSAAERRRHHKAQRQLMAAHHDHDEQQQRLSVHLQAAWQPRAASAPPQPTQPPWTDGLSTSPPTAVKSLDARCE